MANQIKQHPYWWESAGPPEPTPVNELPKEVDVLVIGAGLTGLSAARTLAMKGKSVLVLDQGEPGIGASSRNGGMIGGGYRVHAEILLARYGTDLVAAQLREMHIDSMIFAKQTMDEESIDCDFQECGRYVAMWLQSEYESFARNLELMQKLAPIAATMVPRSRQHEEIASDSYSGGAVYSLHGGLNPAKWVGGLRKAAIRRGALVQGNTAVLGLDREHPDFIAETARGQVRAGDVLIATNGYTNGRFGAVGHSIFPVPSYIIATEHLGSNLVGSLFPTLRMIVETRERHCYFRPSPDGNRIVFGGRAAMFQAGHRFFEKQLQNLLTGIFPELRGVGITHSWKGNTGFTFGMEPHVGRIGGLWHAMGYCGNGNAMAPWLGHKAALAIANDPDGETAFARTRLQRRWWYRGSPWFLPFADLGFRARDIVSNYRRRSQR